MKAEKFPVNITVKGVPAVIRKTSKMKAGKLRDYFIVEYFLKGKRKQVWRAARAGAEAVARSAWIEVSNSNDAELEMSDRDRLVYFRANESVAALGIPLDVAASDYAAAVKNLPPGATLKEAVDFFRARNCATLETRTVQQVANEFLTVKRAAKWSEAHLADLESRLNRIGSDFQINIGGVSGVMIQVWLDNLNVRGRTKKNYLRVIGALFRFAISRKYLPKDAADEIKAVQPPRNDTGEIEIFTPAEIREVLAAARPEMIPFLAIGAFAGLRSAEIARLEWQEVNLKERNIEIKASKAKTRTRRNVPITDNLAQWLAPHVKLSGKVVTFGSWWNQIPKVADVINKRRGETPPAFTWKHNALRHSFCSYRIVAVKNAAQVAMEAGNSQQMIFSHYRQLVNEKQAAEWFSISPPRKPQSRKLVLPENVKHVLQNDRQASALAEVEPAKRVEVLEKAAQSGPVTAKTIQEAAA
jgi:integrase